MNKNHVPVWGRTLDEYSRMFGLDNELPFGKILSIADGPSTFNLEKRLLGINVVSVDPIYNMSVSEIIKSFKESYVYHEELFAEYPLIFNFKNGEEVKHLLAKRLNTFNLFIEDYDKNRKYYQYGKLPDLHFEDNSFDLCLCSNFLFIFEHVFDIAFHIESIKEMLRVSKEIRIFPLYDNLGGESKSFEYVKQYLTTNNYEWTIDENNYHIYKNGNRFLKIKQ